jgi:putative DNA primase/helicase
MSSGDNPVKRVLSRLEDVKQRSGYHVAKCPAHDDREPSLSVSEGDDGKVLLKCHAGCDVEEIVGAMGLHMSDLFGRRSGQDGGGIFTPIHSPVAVQPCTLETYARLKRLQPGYLESLGLSDTRYSGDSAIGIPYKGTNGETVAMRFRVALENSQGSCFRWKMGSKPVPYGLWLLEKMKGKGYVVLVEGESDAHTLWARQIPALGLPGASTWKDEWASYLDGFDNVYAVIEPDGAGDTLREKLVNSSVRDRLHLVDLGVHKDASGLYLADPRRFGDNWRTALKAATRPTLRDGKLKSVGTLLSEVSPETVEWLWEGRIPKGKLTVIEGDPGTGKSLLTMYLAACVSTGAPLHGGSKTEAAGVVLLSAEDGIGDTIRPRLDAAGGDPEKVLSLTTLGEGDEERSLSLPDDILAIERGIEEVSARLVIVDPLVIFLNPKLDPYKDKDVRQALAPLAALAQRTGTAIVVVRHLTKAEKGKALYRGGGSIGIIGAARSGLLVAEHPEDRDRRVLAAQKGNLAKPAPSLAFSLEEADNGAATVVWQGESRLGADQLLAPSDGKQSELSKARAFLEELLADGPVSAAKVQEEAQRNGIAKRTLDRAKRELGVRSEKRQGEWVWVLPTEGSQAPSPDHGDNLGDVGDLEEIGSKERDLVGSLQGVSTTSLGHEEDCQGCQECQCVEPDENGDVADTDLQGDLDPFECLKLYQLLDSPDEQAGRLARARARDEEYDGFPVEIRQVAEATSRKLAGSTDRWQRYAPEAERFIEQELKQDEGVMV